MFSSGHDLGLARSRCEECTPGPDQHPTAQINGGTRKGAEKLMLQEWHYFFENTLRWRNLRKITIAQVHGDVYAAGLMLHVGLRPDRRRRRRHASPTSSAPGSACAASSTSATRGSSARARPRSCCSPATRSTPRRPTGSAWSARSSRADELQRPHARVRPAHRAAADDGRAAHQGVGQPDASTTWASTTRCNACFTLHELNHSHWAWVQRGPVPDRRRRHRAIPNWRAGAADRARGQGQGPGRRLGSVHGCT